MMRTVFAILLMVFAATSYAATVPVLGEGDSPFQDEGPFWADNESVRIKIDPAVNGSFVSNELVFDIFFDNFTYQPDQATALPSQYANGKKESNAGHIHVYATWLGDNSTDPSSPDFWNYTNVFLGAGQAVLTEPGVLETTLSFPALGQWMIFAEAQYADHTSRVRPHPQQLGAWDVAYVEVANVVPEPGSALLLAVASLPLVLIRSRNA